MHAISQLIETILQSNNMKLRSLDCRYLVQFYIYIYKRALGRALGKRIDVIQGSW